MDPALLAFDTAQEAAEACGFHTLHCLTEAVRERGTAFLAVSGGSTPRIMFEWMARQPFDWSGIHIFWVDERCVPPDDAQSNYRMTRESLLDHIPVLPHQIHRIEGECPPAEAAERYVRQICGSLGDEPVFDVIQRGMGADGHTASLFPGEPLIRDRSGIAAAVWVEKLRQHRVTLLPGVLERARHTVCLVAGADKKEALRSVLTGPVDLMLRPAQIRSSHMNWYFDQAAAGS